MTQAALATLPGAASLAAGVQPSPAVDAAMRVAQQRALPAIRERAADPALKQALQPPIAELDKQGG